MQLFEKFGVKVKDLEKHRIISRNPNSQNYCKLFLFHPLAALFFVLDV